MRLAHVVLVLRIMKLLLLLTQPLHIPARATALATAPGATIPDAAVADAIASAVADVAARACRCCSCCGDCLMVWLSLLLLLVAWPILLFLRLLLALVMSLAAAAVTMMVAATLKSFTTSSFVMFQGDLTRA